MRCRPLRAAATIPVRSLAAGGAALALAGCGGATASATAPTNRPARSSPTASATGLTASFADDSLPRNWESAGATVQRGTADTDPATSVRLDAVGTRTGTPAYLSPKPRLLATGHEGFTFRGRFRVTARTPGTTVGLATVENARRTENADLFVDARTGRCRVDLFRDDTALSSGRCDDGRWHTVTLTGDFGSATPTLAWTLDGTPMRTIRSAGLAPSTVHRLWIGDATPGKTSTSDWADLRFRLR